MSTFVEDFGTITGGVIQETSLLQKKGTRREDRWHLCYIGFSPGQNHGSALVFFSAEETVMLKTILQTFLRKKNKHAPQVRKIRSVNMVLFFWISVTDKITHWKKNKKSSRWQICVLLVSTLRSWNFEKNPQCHSPTSMCMVQKSISLPNFLSHRAKCNVLLCVFTNLAVCESQQSTGVLQDKILPFSYGSDSLVPIHAENSSSCANVYSWNLVQVRFCKTYLHHILQHKRLMFNQVSPWYDIRHSTIRQNDDTRRLTRGRMFWNTIPPCHVLDHCENTEFAHASGCACMPHSWTLAHLTN